MVSRSSSPRRQVQHTAPTAALPASRPALWRDGLFWLTLALTVFAVMPFALPGYFWGANDARHHVYFLFEYDRLVQDGIWWPRWSPDFAFGYGYPFFNIYGPFSHFLAELLLHFLHFDYTDAVETIFGLSIVASAASMFLFVRDWAGRRAALISALVYTYIPYHLLNLYVRANLAESMAFVWLPLSLWCVRMATVQPRWRWVAGAAVAYAGLMVTSNLVIVLFTPLLGLYLVVVAIVYAKSDPHSRWPARLWAWVQTAFWPGMGVLAGLGLSAVFWIPAFTERQYVRVDQWFAGRYDYQSNFVFFQQLFSPRWGFGISQPGPDDAISFQIGAAALVLAVIGILAAWRRSGRLRWEIALFALAAIGSVFVALQVAAPLWKLPIVGSILGVAQFPWRWYSIMAVCLSILAGLVLGDAQTMTAPVPSSGAAHDVTAHPAAAKTLDLALFLLAAMIILASYVYLKVQVSEPVEGPVSLAGLMRFQQSSDEMTGSTAWVKEIPTWSPMADYYIQQDAAGKPVTAVTTNLDYNIFDYKTFAADSIAHSTVMEEVYFFNQRQDGERLIFNHFYYPGWKAYLLSGKNGTPTRELPIIPEESGVLGRMTIPLPLGEGYVLLRYEDTPPRTLGRWISWVTVGVLLLAGIAGTAMRRRTQ